MRVAFLMYDGMDLMDFAGPHEVVLTANRLLARFHRPPVFDVVTASRDGAPVSCYGGLVVTPGSSVAEASGAEVVVVPGAIDIAGRLRQPELVTAVSRLAKGAVAVTSVCTGAFLLGEAGLLDQAEWTTHWEDIAALADRVAGSSRRARVVESGRIVTAGGLACGIDLGLHLVARFADPALARLVARQLDYAWDAYGAEAGGREPVVLERTVAADPATLYRMWTTSDGVRRFSAAESVIETRIGGRYEFRFLPEEPDGLRGGEGCRILALEPDRMVTFTWNSPPGMATRGIHTWVVLTFTAAGAGRTTVRLAHWGHGEGPEWDANRTYFRSAWDRVLTRLEAALD